MLCSLKNIFLWDCLGTSVSCSQLGYEPHPHVRTPGLGSNGLGGIPGGKP
jgi:hypothetical protein